MTLLAPAGRSSSFSVWSPTALALLAAVAGTLGCATTQPSAPSSENPSTTKLVPGKPPSLEAPTLRLPAGVKPSSYALDLRVVPGASTFSGTVTIELDLAVPLEVLWLNANELTPGAASFHIGEQTVLAEAKVVTEQLLAVIPSRPLAAGKATLTLAYSGPLSTKDSAGLFQVRKGDESYAYTHFEPIDARRAFPCFDEPQFKVPWQLTLHVRREHVALSNTPVSSEREEPDGMKAVTFSRTPPLPSYLVALAVGPFEVADAGTWGQHKTHVHIVTPKGQVGEAKWALESTGQALETLEQYFGLPYPFEKLDLISVGLPMGAMENPGLVTFGQQLILSRPEEDTLSRQRSFAGVCAHELAHMWFGDLVTMAWWDDLWLNEAFATWMSAKAIAVWKPTWDAEVGQARGRGGALGIDGMMSARQIRQPITSDDDITNAFDGITYTKGAAVISMFERWVGPDVFQRGVRQYLEAHARGNATAADFLGAISTAAGRDVATPFSTFLDQPGAPRITMSLSCLKGAPPKLELAQRRFLPVGSTGDAHKVWQVPVCVRYSVKGHETQACTLLTEEHGALELTGAASCPEWVLPNDAMRGYYRASLEGTTDLVRLMSAAGKHLSVAERVGVLSDLRALVSSGDVDLGLALSAIPLAAADPSRHVVETSIGLATTLGQDLLPEPLRPKYAALVRSSFGPRAKQLGLTVASSDDEDTRLLRPSVVGLVGVEGEDPALREQSVKLARQWLDDRHAVHPDLVDTVLGIAAETGDAALHEKLLVAAKAEKDRADLNRMLGALAAYRPAELVKAQLPLTLGDAFDIRDSFRLVWGASSDFRTRALALDFVESNWDSVIAKLPKGNGAWLPYLAGGSCDAAHREAARTFFDGRSTKFRGGPRNLANALEGIDLCIAFRARQRPSAIAFLQSWKPPAASAPTKLPTAPHR